ncbi:hypothetical protein CABS03_02460 [Colletotrichum abscissum]|uniref:Uncharacterized protein n=2 Tax=Colletotrichum abscissum TaxID=1671311 RepID=A0A9Q0B7P5_9PEZI|nr:hypothetical protein CABS02_01527 [Colletotrichum abscissum]
MKQVVGSAFWGLTEDDRVQEAEIIEMVADASSQYVEGIDRNQEDLKGIRRPIYEKLHALLHLRAKAYIESIVDRLFDEKTPLKWHPGSNNCQKFCDNLINRSLFGSFMVYARDCKQEKHPPSQILYLLSFVCRKGCHDGFPKKVIPLSRETASNGHTEEFLLRYRQFDHHNDTDIIDSLVEYWTDWGGFREPIFRYQGLFPWDCTEARTQEEEDLQPQVKCGECRLTKHLWAFPFDAWSVAQLHMFRERQFYTPSYNDSSQSSSQIGYDEWMDNRLSVLEALEVLGCIAVAMHRSDLFRSSCQWNFKAHGVVFFNTARSWGLFHKNKRRSKLKKLKRHGHGNLVPRAGSNLMEHDRVKLAGIHRAQPFSHSYEHVKGHDCTLADWADAAHDCQVEAYKALRDSRSVGVDKIIANARFSSSAVQANVGPKALGTEGAFPSTDGAFVAEGLDGFGASVDFTSGSLCDCMCDFTGLTGFEQAQDLGGWDFSDGGDGFSHDCDGGGVDGGWGGLDAGMDGGGGGGGGVDGGGGM